MSEKKTYQVGTSIFTLIFIVFLFLKLAGIGVVATWSWWAVTSPLWVPWAIVLTVVLLIFTFTMFVKN